MSEANARHPFFALDLPLVRKRVALAAGKDRQERLVTGVLTTHIVSYTDKYGGVAVDVNFHHSGVWPPCRRFLDVVLCQLSQYCLKSA